MFFAKHLGVVMSDFTMNTSEQKIFDNLIFMDDKSLPSKVVIDACLGTTLRIRPEVLLSNLVCAKPKVFADTVADLANTYNLKLSANAVSSIMYAWHTPNYSSKVLDECRKAYDDGSYFSCKTVAKHLSGVSEKDLLEAMLFNSAHYGQAITSKWINLSYLTERIIMQKDDYFTPRALYKLLNRDTRCMSY